MAQRNRRTEMAKTRIRSPTKWRNAQSGGDEQDVLSGFISFDTHKHSHQSSCCVVRQCAQWIIIWFLSTRMLMHGGATATTTTTNSSWIQNDGDGPARWWRNWWGSFTLRRRRLVAPNNTLDAFIISINIISWDSTALSLNYISRARSKAANCLLSKSVNCRM